MLGSGGYRGFAIAALCQGVLAAGLALPLLRSSRARSAAFDKAPRSGHHGRRHAHHVSVPAGITVIDYLTNLDAIVVPRCPIIALLLAIDGVAGSRIRASALVG